MLIRIVRQLELQASTDQWQSRALQLTFCPPAVDPGSCMDLPCELVFVVDKYERDCTLSDGLSHALFRSHTLSLLFVHMLVRVLDACL